MTYDKFARYTHTHKLTVRHALMHTYRHTHTDTHIYTHTYTHTYTHIQTFTHKTHLKSVYCRKTYTEYTTATKEAVQEYSGFQFGYIGQALSCKCPLFA